MPNPALLTTRSIGSLVGRDPLGDGGSPVGGPEVGLEHLEAVVAIGDLAQAVDAARDEHGRDPASPSSRAISAPMPDEAPVTSADVNG